MTLHIPFDNSYARLPADFYTRLKPEPVPAPKLVAFNEPLAEELGIRKTWALWKSSPFDPDLRCGAGTA